MILKYNINSANTIYREIYYYSLFGYKTEMTNAGVPKDYEDEKNNSNETKIINFWKPINQDNKLEINDKQKKRCDMLEKRFFDISNSIYQYQISDSNFNDLLYNRLKILDEYTKIKGLEKIIYFNDSYNFYFGDDNYKIITIKDADSKEYFIPEIKDAMEKGYKKLVWFDLNKILTPYTYTIRHVRVWEYSGEEEWFTTHESEKMTFNGLIILKKDDNAPKSIPLISIKDCFKTSKTAKEKQLFGCEMKLNSKTYITGYREFFDLEKEYNG